MRLRSRRCDRADPPLPGGDPAGVFACMFATAIPRYHSMWGIAVRGSRPIDAGRACGIDPRPMPARSHERFHGGFHGLTAGKKSLG
jgi:hypothetical protein